MTSHESEDSTCQTLVFLCTPVLPTTAGAAPPARREARPQQDVPQAEAHWLRHVSVLCSNVR